MQPGNVGMHGSEARGKLNLTSAAVMAVCRLITVEEDLVVSGEVSSTEEDQVKARRGYENRAISFPVPC